ncbi:acetoacetate--CoA ligase [Dactylosporangium sp. CA-233914]|uniref:acetoacetate--CoA ligase n=1 Tax=Dactylosporangium sp. CA-233914 TaxID=3239934 RepID=UPI003D948167
MDGDVLWTPAADAVERTKMGRLMRRIEQRHSVVLGDYDSFWRWSVENVATFYTELADFSEVRFDTPPQTALTSLRVPDAQWFPGATLNYAEHVFRCMPQDIVIRAVSETRGNHDVSAAELRDQVGRIRRGLVELGVGKGDRVAGYLPHIPETVAAFLAVASLGAVWSVCPPEFGVNSVVDRLSQVAPKVLIAVDGYRFAGKDYDRGDQLREILEALPSVETAVWLPYLGTGERPPTARSWDEVFAEPGEVTFAAVPFDHTLYVLFTSGTTGLPKAVPHSHGGPLLEHHKWLGLQADLGEGDRLFWFSTTGWVVWNISVSALTTGASIVVMDGSPTHPGLDKQWRMIHELGITHFGASTAFVLACKDAGMHPGRDFDLSPMRVAMVGGSPFPAAGWEWFYREVRDDILVGCSSGGTDVAGTFIGGSPLVPVRSGRQACVYLGVRVEAWDQSGKPVIGVPGELVVTTPLPSMPKALWADPDGSRLRETYYHTFPDVWDQQDWAIFYEDGSCSVIGRSDATLNRAGVRLGPSEYYAVLDAMPGIREGLIVHVQTGSSKDGELFLFVVLEEGAPLDPELEGKVKAELAKRLSPRHVPDVIHAVPDLPKTLTGKRLEVPVRRILEGADPDTVTSRGTLANPEALESFVELARRRTAAATTA